MSSGAVPAHAERSTTPIWERERIENEKRREQSMMIRNMQDHLRSQAAQTAQYVVCHPGLFKTTYRENFDSSGAVLLSPEGRIWTCCRQASEASPGCQVKIVEISRKFILACFNFSFS